MAGAVLALALLAAPADAQRKPDPPKPPAAKDKDKEEPAAAEPKFEAEGKGALLQGLDKVTTKISAFDADNGKLVRFGTLEITVRKCTRSRPDQKLERAAFLEIDDIDPSTKAKKRVFSGWMFSSNPSLSALDHPVYDVWVKDCR